MTPSADTLKKEASKLEKAKTILRVLRKKGFEAMIVGGAVRDRILGRESKDYDIATNAEPSQVEALFKKTIGVGKQFGVILVILGGEQFEVATFRKDLEYTDGRRPVGVEFSNAREDVLRRDFTINGLFWHPETDELVDYVEGIPDIEKRLIRCIGNPCERFEEDKLRVLRAIRFSSNLDFEIEKKTWEAVCDRTRFDLSVISRERIRVEFEKILTRPHTFKGLILIEKAGLKEHVLEKDFFPPGEAYPGYLKKFLDHTLEIPLERALSLLYLGSSCLTRGGDSEIFTAGDRTETDLRLLNLRDFLKTMTYSNRTADGVFNILKLTLELMRNSEPDTVFLRKSLGHEWGMEAYQVIRTLARVFEGHSFLTKKLEEVLKVYNTSAMLPKPCVTGGDLSKMGLKPGPLFGRILAEAYDYQLAHENLDKKELLAILKEKGVF